MLIQKIFPEEKFIIKSPLNREEVLKILKENVQEKNPFWSKSRYFTGMVTGYKFKIQNCDEYMNGMPYVFQGEIKEDSSIAVRMAPDTSEDKTIRDIVTLFFDFVIITFLIFYAVILFHEHKNGIGVNSYWLLINLSLYYLLIRFCKMKAHRTKAHLNKMFNGKIEKLSR